MNAEEFAKLPINRQHQQWDELDENEQNQLWSQMSSTHRESFQASRASYVKSVTVAATSEPSAAITNSRGGISSQAKKSATVQDTLQNDTRSVIKRLETLSSIVRFAWIIVGIILGGALGISVGTNFDSSAFMLVGAIVGGLVGGVVGSLSAVIIDWQKQMLLLQDKIANNTKN